VTPQLQQTRFARVLFDESHGEAWSIRPEAAGRMRPEHPSAASYAGAAQELAERDFAVAAHESGPLTAAVLAGADVLVIAHPSEPEWEGTLGDPPALSPDEIGAVRDFVGRGGGLLVLAETEEKKYGANLDEVLAPFGLGVQNTTVFDYAGSPGNPTWVPAEADPAPADAALLHQVRDVRFYRAGSLEAPPGAGVLRAGPEAAPAGASLLAAVSYGRGRVVVAADSDVFGDDFLQRLDHRQLWLNIMYWLALPAFRGAAAPLVSAAAADPAWTRLREATDELRLLQGPRGDVDLSVVDGDRVRALVHTMSDAVEILGTRFPHQAEYLERLVRDLAAWLEAGCGKPDFGPSLDAFRPERERRDGVEHLVVFPLYTPNASPDVRFEALLVRTPWPAFVAELERTEFDNGKFVPVQLVDHTLGYASECAVLFPETVSLAQRPSNNFGGIFCDRESGRFRRAVSAAAEVLGLDLPPDATALVASPDLSLETYIMWDLIHDRWHSHGELPFDPFMIRQRLPYWMYSLEELRVDLATYGSAAELLERGFHFARYVQYAILFDRVLRFPITGARVRNYDGLGGQLLFAFLHRRRAVTWRDNRLAVDWDIVGDAVGELRARLDDLYRRGIDMSKVSYWTAAHDLIAQFVEPNVGSQWRREARVVTDEADTRAWVDRVLPDEFPLSTFYLALQKRLAERAEATEAVAATETASTPERVAAAATQTVAATEKARPPA
jgi:hypothetical protein